jgi:hypothetical protein
MTKSGLRSTERVPTPFFDQPRAPKVNEQTTAAWAKDHVLILDISVYWNRKHRQLRGWVANRKRHTDPLGMEEVECVSNLAKIGPDHVWRETIWVSFYEFEEIGWGSWFYVDRGDAWHNKVIVVNVFKKVEQRANIGVALDL